MVFASMRAVPLFLQARAVINFLMRAESTLEITNGEQRALRKFSAGWNLSLLKSCFVPRNLQNRTLVPGTELWPVRFNKRQQNEEAFFQKHSWARMFPQCSQFPILETLSPVSVFVSKMQIMLTLHGREF